MMNFANPQQTPMRPLPGQFVNTPAPGAMRQPSFGSNPPPAFRLPSQQAVPQRQAASTQSQSISQQSEQQTGMTAPSAPAPRDLSPVELAKTAINEKLEAEGRFPPLEEYIGQEISHDYRMDSAAWAPFQKIKQYEIPDRIMEQIDKMELVLLTGIFAELNHAWVVVDSALYFWDYTHPNPDQAELIGFEELSHPITAVQLVKPRAGVFVSSITHLLVVASDTDLHLIGVASSKSAAGVTSISLYQTGMSVSMKGITVSCITGSDKTGRIFVGAESSNDIYEITYQKEEEWFASKCGKKCQTEKSMPIPLQSYLPIKPFLALMGAAGPTEHVKSLVVDDSRDLLYALSTLSTISVHHIKPGFSLPRLMTKTMSDLMTSIRHMAPPPEFVRPGAAIASISAIASSESSRLNLMVTTKQGLRILLSATSGNYYSNDGLPTSMQPYHVKLPPVLPASLRGTDQPNPPPGSRALHNAIPTKDTTVRYAPGYFAAFVGRDDPKENPEHELLFLSSPDSGSIAFQYAQQNPRRSIESGQWIPLHSLTQGVGLMTPLFAAASGPKGFGNELAVQFDQTATEIAILTNSGVHTFRRRRLVDIFASAVRASEAQSEDGFKNELTKFQQRYGAREMCATALAVACGQAKDVMADARVAKIRDDDVIQRARDTFVKHGGMPSIRTEFEIVGEPSIEHTQLSHRAEGLLIYLTRLVRPVWKASLLTEIITPAGGLTVSSTISLAKLHDVQHDVAVLQDFLKEQTKSIAGLAGPESLSGVGNKHDEIALRGEHRTLHALVKSIENIIEGIAFVQVLFDDPVDELVLALSPQSRQRVRELTYERLFCTADGREMAKEMVKAIVNRSIAKGANVDTVAEALRRRCGSFCSADDVVIFKAQELLNKASEAGAESASARNLLNESLKLFQKVAGSLSSENLQQATEQYIAKSFYGGAIRLALTVAQQRDRSNQAKSFINDGSPTEDKRRSIWEARTSCYQLVFSVIEAVDQTWRDSQSKDELTINAMAKRKAEAYLEVDESDDEVFQTSLYEWYIRQGWTERLLEVKSDHVVKFLQKKNDLVHQELLWKYYARNLQFLNAATTQVKIAQSASPEIKLSKRIEYLSRAKANASTRTNGLSDFGRSVVPRGETLRIINDLIDVANVQQDVLFRLMDDDRISAEKKAEVATELDNQIKSLDYLYNQYVDQAGYFDISLVIYNLADYRNAADVTTTWASHIHKTDEDARKKKNVTPAMAVAEEVVKMGRRLECSDTTFPIPMLLPQLIEYALKDLPDAPANNPRAAPVSLESYTWPIDKMLDLEVPYETLVTVLEDIFYSPEATWAKQKTKSRVAQLLVYTVEAWFDVSARGQGIAFGSDENAVKMLELVKQALAYLDSSRSKEGKDAAERVRDKVERVLW
ncbi:non-repetitive nucleoporin [Venturia nashicola]|nr:non-repetitive nucleoporin [Venturia nashicola]